MHSRFNQHLIFAYKILYTAAVLSSESGYLVCQHSHLDTCFNRCKQYFVKSADLHSSAFSFKLEKLACSKMSSVDQCICSDDVFGFSNSYKCNK